MKVSIIVPTFNHQPYIRQCLDSLVNQKTTFPYEILVGEDESSDGTREICLEYAKKYPDKIRLFLNKRKDVVYIKGYPTGRSNIINLLKNARGQYIAFCDGDDYWQDILKIQKQVEFLDNYSPIGLVHTGAALLLEKNQRIVPKVHHSLQPEVLAGNVYEYLLRKSFIVTVTMMVRKKWVDAFLNWEKFDHFQYLMFDYPLKLYVAYNSKIGFIPDITATHRILLESASNSRNIQKMVDFYQSQYEIVQFFCDHFGCSEKTRRFIDVRFARLFLKRFTVLGNSPQATHYFKKLRELKSIARLNWKDYFYYYFSRPWINPVFRKIYTIILSRKATSF